MKILQEKENKKFDDLEILSVDDAANFINEVGKNKKIVVVSGVTGQDGSYMVDFLLENTDYIILGGVRRLSVYNHENLAHINSDRFRLINFDLNDSYVISRIIEKIKPHYFINLAAQSFVASSWDFAKQTFKTNCNAVLDILEAIRLYCPSCRFYNAGCHDTETRVLTKQGLKQYTEVKVGDLVYSINPKTLDLEFKKILKVFEYDFDGKLYEFRNGGLRVTPNHKMLYNTPSFKNKELKIKEASNFINLSSAIYPKNNPVKGKILEDTYCLKKFVPTKKKDTNKTYGKHIESINTMDLMYLIGVYIGDGSTRILKKKCKVSSNKLAKRDCLGKFSKKEKDKDVIYDSPQTVIDIPETDVAFKKVTEILDKNNIKWSLHNQCDITFCQWGLHYIFKECGQSSLKKRIPSWIFGLHYKYQEKVYEGIIDSDGDDRGVVSTISTQLIEDIIKLNLNCGKSSSFSSRPPRESKLKDGRIIKSNHPENVIHARQRNIVYQKKQKNAYSLIPYKGKVWCLEVEDNHNFVVERNGQITFSGNSSEEFGDVSYSPQDEKHPLRPRSPYAASKASARQLVKVYRDSYNLYAVQGWLFNHEGERRGHEFVTRKITKGVARIYSQMIKGKPFEPISLGNMSAKRDWSDAEDFVRGIWMMLNQEEHNKELAKEFEEKGYQKGGILLPKSIEDKKREFAASRIKDYVLASGETHTVAEFVDLAFDAAGIDGYFHFEEEGNWETASYRVKFSDDVLVNVNKKYFRPAEVELLYGNPSEICRNLGWSCDSSFKDLVRKMVKNDIENLGLEFP